MWRLRPTPSRFSTATSARPEGQLLTRAFGGVEKIERAEGLVRIEGIAEEVGWSRRHLAARFRSTFGVTPKVAARLFRFEAATPLLKAA